MGMVGVVRNDLARQYQQKLSALELKRVEVMRLNQDFESKMRNKEVSHSSRKWLFASVSVSLPLCLCRCLSLCLSVSLSPSPPPPLSLSVSMYLSVYPSISLSACVLVSLLFLFCLFFVSLFIRLSSVGLAGWMTRWMKM